MLLGLISDVHANQLALEACLRHCETLGVNRLVFLGDLVGYGPDPQAVVRQVRELVANGAMALLGNHDEAVFGSSAGMNEIAARAIAWTKTQLDDGAIAFLESLPLTATMDDVLFVHADASAPSRWNYVLEAEAARRSLSATRARVTFCGHVHVPQLFCMTATGKVIAHAPATGIAISLAEQRRWLGVAGAAGQPRDGNPAASFLTYDTAALHLTYRRAPYDHETAAARIRAAGLPERLATRLLAGT